MKRSALLWTTLAAFGLLLGACSDQNAPDTQPHPDDWVLSHGSDPGATGRANDCTACHGSALDGGSAAVAWIGQRIGCGRCRAVEERPGQP